MRRSQRVRGKYTLYNEHQRQLHTKGYVLLKCIDMGEQCRKVINSVTGTNAYRHEIFNYNREENTDKLRFQYHINQIQNVQIYSSCINEFTWIGELTNAIKKLSARSSHLEADWKISRVGGTHICIIFILNNLRCL